MNWFDPLRCGHFLLFYGLCHCPLVYQAKQGICTRHLGFRGIVCILSYVLIFFTHGFNLQAELTSQIEMSNVAPVASER